jgi:hypothetical protein
MVDRTRPVYHARRMHAGCRWHALSLRICLPGSKLFCQRLGYGRPAYGRQRFHELAAPGPGRLVGGPQGCGVGGGGAGDVAGVGGRGEIFFSSPRARVRTSPGYSETTVTPWSSSSCAMSRVSLSVAALAAPQAVSPRYFCAAQNEMLAIRPDFYATSGARPAGWPCRSHVPHPRTSRPSATAAAPKMAAAR